jgi:hypothetical protein
MFLASTRPVSMRRAAYVPAHAFASIACSTRRCPRLASPAPPAAPKSHPDESGWTLSLDVPGVSKEQLNIGIEGQVGAHRIAGGRPAPVPACL